MRVKDKYFDKIKNNGLNNGLDYEEYAWLPEEKETFISMRDDVYYLSTHLRIVYYIAKFPEYIKIETVDKTGRINYISAKIPKDQVVITRKPNRNK